MKENAVVQFRGNAFSQFFERENSHEFVDGPSTKLYDLLLCMEHTQMCFLNKTT